MVNEELFDVLDINGNKTGEIVPRSLAHREGILHGASHIFIYKVDHFGKIYILLQRRSHNKDSFPDCLDISSAGHVPHGMDFLETAQKELEEELGIKIEGNELVRSFIQHFSKVSEQHGEVFNNNEINMVYILKKDIDISEIKLQEEEVSEVIWLQAETVLEKIKARESEYCLDELEFTKVLQAIKEREKKEFPRRSIRTMNFEKGQDR